MLRKILFFVMCLSLIPALILGWNRIRYEESYKTLAVIFDYASLDEQASNLNTTPEDLLRQYKPLGVNGVALYEDTVQSAIKRNELLYQSGSTLLAINPNSQAKPAWHYYRSVKAGTVEALTRRYNYKYDTLKVDNTVWYGWPLDIRGMPIGPNTALIQSLKQQGYQVVYRPIENSAVIDPAADLPDVRYIAFAGSQVLGNSSPENLEKVKSRLGDRLPAFIEATDQKGLEDIIKDHPTVRLFSLKAAWQNTLKPAEVASKFVLAARERSHRLLYVRPFETIEDTQTMLKGIQEGLTQAKFSLGAPVAFNYQPNSTLRYLACLGPLAALALLALSYPLAWLGAVVGVFVLLGTLAIGDFSFASGALLAGVAFPVLGFALRRKQAIDWLLATGLSLMGVFFLTAIGTDRAGMLGLAPFKGVSLTLLLPVMLYLGLLVPNQDIRITLRNLYQTPLRLGDILLMVVALAVVALVFLRRGNTPSIGVSDAESELRTSLQDALIRPRFKELIGHPIALLSLSGAFPSYISALMLVGGIVGQASVLNTFGHYHTPLLISLLRAFNGIWIGGLIGLLAIPVVLWIVRWFNATPKNTVSGESA